MKLIWPAALTELKSDKAAHEWVFERVRSRKIWEDGENLEDSFDKRRLGFLHPQCVRNLLNEPKWAISRYFPLLENMICLRRSMASKIPKDFDSTDMYLLRDCMEPYFFSTMYCELRDDEKADQQWLHREASRRFLDKVRASKKAASQKGLLRGTKDQIVYPVAEMRELLITTMSTKLRMFHEICQGLNTDTLVDTLQQHREHRFDGFRFVQFLCSKLGLATPTTALGYLRFLTEGSPILRSIIHYVCEGQRFLKPRKEGKLLIVEDVPLNAAFLEWSLNLLGVETALFHSGLTQGERFALQEEFNDPNKSLSVMILMYDVGGVGINLWYDCGHVVLATAAKNEGGEKQAGGRVIRVCSRLLAKKDFFEAPILTSIYRHHKKDASRW